MPCCSPKCVIPNFPIHLMVVTQEPVEGESLEWKNAATLQKRRNTESQHYVQVKIEATVPIDCQIPKKIVPLNGKPKGIEDVPVVGELCIDESVYLAVIEEYIFVIRIQESDIAHHGAGPQRLLGILSTLDDALWNSMPPTPCGVRIGRQDNFCIWLKLTLHEGRMAFYESKPCWGQGAEAERLIRPRVP
jgi:hypothetical protein